MDAMAYVMLVRRLSCVYIRSIILTVYHRAILYSTVTIIIGIVIIIAAVFTSVFFFFFHTSFLFIYPSADVFRLGRDMI